MRRTRIRAIAVGAAMIGIALSPPRRAAASDGDADVTFGDADPAMRVEPHPIATESLDAAPGTTMEADIPPFVWTTDLTLAPPPNLAAAMDSQFAPPPTNGTAIPLPPAAWTGFASLAGLGTIALVRKLRHGR